MSVSSPEQQGTEHKPRARAAATPLTVTVTNLHGIIPDSHVAPGSGVCGPCRYAVRNSAIRGSSAESTPSWTPQAVSVMGEAWSG